MGHWPPRRCQEGQGEGVVGVGGLLHPTTDLENAFDQLKPRCKVVEASNDPTRKALQKSSGTSHNPMVDEALEMDANDKKDDVNEDSNEKDNNISMQGSNHECY